MTSKTGRRLFFWILVLLFFSTSAVVLFLAFGYSFDEKRGIFVHTGSFTLKTIPLETIDIHIDGKSVPKRKLNILNDAYHISGQMPGEHIIKVSAPGYSTWKKKTVIESGRSTEFWNINLVATAYRTFSVPETHSALRIFPSPKENLLAILRDNSISLSVEAFDTARGTLSLIAQFNNTDFPDFSEENLEWSPDAKSILLPVSRDGKRDYVFASQEKNDTEYLLDRSGLSEMRFARWDSRREKVFYFLSESSLFEWDISRTNSTPIRLAEHVAGYDVSQQYIYVLDLSDGFVKKFRSGSSLESAETISLKPLPQESLSSSELTVYDSDRLVIRNRDTGTLFLQNIGKEDRFERKEGGVRGVQFSNDGKKLLFFTDREIFVSFLRNWDTQPTRAEGETTQIARFSEPIRFVQWAKNYEHILFSLKSEIQTIELDGRDRRIAEKVLSLTNEPKQVFANFSSDGVFFIDGSPESSLSYFSFPENFEEPTIEIPQENTL